MVGILHTFFMFSHISGAPSFQQPLSPEEEKACLEAYATGCTEARNTLIERNLRLVAHIAKKYHSRDSEDLISIGTVGLIKGVTSFDPQKGAKLATYASRCIENAICFGVTHITPFLTLHEKIIRFGALQENMNQPIFDNDTFQYPTQKPKFGFIIYQFNQPWKLHDGLLRLFDIGKLLIL